jgi:hypothetical protein
MLIPVSSLPASDCFQLISHSLRGTLSSLQLANDISLAQARRLDIFQMHLQNRKYKENRKAMSLRTHV